MEITAIGLTIFGCRTSKLATAVRIVKGKAGNGRTNYLPSGMKIGSDSIGKSIAYHACSIVLKKKDSCQSHVPNPSWFDSRTRMIGDLFKKWFPKAAYYLIYTRKGRNE